jgi:predicted DCC family thiol-disulfide oxidoreductase YuxK
VDGVKVRQAGLPVLIFDGDCGFCTSAVRFARTRIDPGLRAQAFQEADLDALGVARERAEGEVLWVEPGGRVYGGSHAVARLLTAAGGVWAAGGAAMKLTLLRWAAQAGYRLIAANRQRLPGGTLHCSVHGTPGRPVDG